MAGPARHTTSKPSHEPHARGRHGASSESSTLNFNRSTTPTPTMSTSSSSPASASSHDDAVANWWEYGSVPLVKRCIREYGWSDKYAARVLGGYKKFLQLKKDLSDWDHKILSPSIPVDKMWHMHILDVANYIKDCELLCGHLVGHDPDGMLNADARKRRVETTRHILQNQLGGEMDEEVWNFGSGGDASTSITERGGENNNSPGRKRRRRDEDTGQIDASSSRSSKKQLKQTESARELITIRLKDGNGEETHFEVSPTTSMGKVMKAFGDEKGISPSSIRLLLEGEQVGEDQTARTLELEDGDLFDVFLEQAAC